jgi:hypothetical protein
VPPPAASDSTTPGRRSVSTDREKNGGAGVCFGRPPRAKALNTGQEIGHCRIWEEGAHNSRGDAFAASIKFLSCVDRRVPSRHVTSEEFDRPSKRAENSDFSRYDSHADDNSMAGQSARART